jgi:predicted transcriptional regulator
MIKWILNWLYPAFSIKMQNDEGMLNIQRRLSKLENESHTPLACKDTVFKIHKRLEDLETAKFVEKFPRMKNYEGTD